METPVTPEKQASGGETSAREVVVAGEEEVKEHETVQEPVNEGTEELNLAWVKLGKIWWPGKILPEAEYTDEMRGEVSKKSKLAKDPAATVYVVTFYNEDNYQVVRNANEIILSPDKPKRYDMVKRAVSSMKASANLAKANKESFRRDVLHNEKLIEEKADLTEITALLDGETLEPKKPVGVSKYADIFPSAKPEKVVPEKSPAGRGRSSVGKLNLITSRIISTASSKPASKISPLPVDSSKKYHCNNCGFSVDRVNVLTSHMKYCTKKIVQTPKTPAKVKTPNVTPKSKDVEKPTPKKVEEPVTPVVKKEKGRPGRKPKTPVVAETVVAVATPSPVKATPKKKRRVTKKDKILNEKQKSEILQDWNDSSSEGGDDTDDELDIGPPSKPPELLLFGSEKNKKRKAEVPEEVPSVVPEVEGVVEKKEGVEGEKNEDQPPVLKKPRTDKELSDAFEALLRTTKPEHEKLLGNDFGDDDDHRMSDIEEDALIVMKHVEEKEEEKQEPEVESMEVERTEEPEKIEEEKSEEKEQEDKVKDEEESKEVEVPASEAAAPTPVRGTRRTRNSRAAAVQAEESTSKNTEPEVKKPEVVVETPKATRRTRRSSRGGATPVVNKPAEVSKVEEVPEVEEPSPAFEPVETPKGTEEEKSESVKEEIPAPVDKPAPQARPSTKGRRSSGGRGRRLASPVVNVTPEPVVVAKKSKAVIASPTHEPESVPAKRGKMGASPTPQEKIEDPKKIEESPVVPEEPVTPAGKRGRIGASPPASETPKTRGKKSATSPAPEPTPVASTRNKQPATPTPPEPPAAETKEPTPPPPAENTATPPTRGRRGRKPSVPKPEVPKPIPESEKPDTEKSAVSEAPTATSAPTAIAPSPATPSTPSLASTRSRRNIKPSAALIEHMMEKDMVSKPQKASAKKSEKTVKSVNLEKEPVEPPLQVKEPEPVVVPEPVVETVSKPEEPAAPATEKTTLSLEAETPQVPQTPEPKSVDVIPVPVVSPAKPVAEALSASPAKPVAESASSVKPVAESASASSVKPVAESASASPVKPVAESLSASPAKQVVQSVSASPVKPVSASPVKPVSASPVKPVSASPAKSVSASPAKPVACSPESVDVKTPEVVEPPKPQETIKTPSKPETAVVAPTTSISQSPKSPAKKQSPEKKPTVTAHKSPVRQPVVPEPIKSSPEKKVEVPAPSPVKEPPTVTETVAPASPVTKPTPPVKKPTAAVRPLVDTKEPAKDVIKDPSNKKLKSKDPTPSPSNVNIQDQQPDTSSNLDDESADGKKSPALVAQRVVHLVPVENADGSITYMLLSLENGSENPGVLLEQGTDQAGTVLRLDKVEAVDAGTTGNLPMNPNEVEGIFLDKSVTGANQIVSALAAAASTSGVSNTTMDGTTAYVTLAVDPSAISQIAVAGAETTTVSSSGSQSTIVLPEGAAVGQAGAGEDGSQVLYMTEDGQLLDPNALGITYEQLQQLLNSQ